MTKCPALLAISLMLVSCSVSPYKCTDPLGCLDIPSGSPIVIGAILATTGEQGPVGIKSLQSMGTAVNEKNLILGHPLQLIQSGTDCSEEYAWIAATTLSLHSDLSVVIGPGCTAEVGIASQILMHNGIPMLGPVPDPLAALNQLEIAFSAIENVAVQDDHQTLHIPRQALFEELSIPKP